MLLLSSADFFSKLTFSQNSFRNTIRVSNGLDPDQDQHGVGPDLSLNSLQRLSPDDKVATSKHRVMVFVFLLQIIHEAMCSLFWNNQLNSTNGRSPSPTRDLTSHGNRHTNNSDNGHE